MVIAGVGASFLHLLRLFPALGPLPSSPRRGGFFWGVPLVASEQSSSGLRNWVFVKLFQYKTIGLFLMEKQMESVGFFAKSEGEFSVE